MLSLLDSHCGLKDFMKNILLLLCLSFWLGAAAQSNVKGTPFNGLVSDSSGARVKSIKIEVKSSGRYTYTDKLGRFGLTDIKPDDVLIISRKDFSVEVTVGGRQSMRIVLYGDALSNVDESAELVEAGFGYIKRRESSPNTGVISGEELRKTGVQDLERALLGRVPGLAMIDGELTMPGKNSINSSTKMLFLVDNQEVPSLSHVTISEIESVVVHKDGGMYGVRGANGVIHVKTSASR